MFTEDSKYNHGNEDQYDWNKLWGMYSLQPCWPMSHADCGMIGWRWNPEYNRFEVTPYTHSSCGERLWVDPIPVKSTMYASITAADKWYYHIRVDGVSYYYEHPRTKRARLFKQMNGYFGGNLPAPKDVTYYIQEL